MSAGKTHVFCCYCEFLFFPIVEDIFIAKICLVFCILQSGRVTVVPRLLYTLSDFQIRCDVTRDRLRASLQVTLKFVYFAAIPCTTCAYYGNSPQIHNNIMSNLEVGQSICKDGYGSATKFTYGTEGNQTYVTVVGVY